MYQITVLGAGGTIDKIYGTGKGVRDLEIGDMAAEDFYLSMVTQGQIKFDFLSVLKKDSLDMNDADRQLLVNACTHSRSSSIIITHGTDTMIDTARKLASHGLDSLGCIVLTGALQPACMRGTDAEMNLGLALGTVIGGRTGILIAMHGVHDWDRCRKDKLTGRFVPTVSTH